MAILYRLVFCLKFKLTPVCEYLNYYCNITNDYWAIPEKFQAEGFQDILFEKNLTFLSLPLYSWKFKTKQIFILGNSGMLCYTPRKFQHQKPRLKKIQHDFFLIFPRKINLSIAAVSLFDSLLVQLRSNEYLEGPECSNYY